MTATVRRHAIGHLHRVSLIYRVSLIFGVLAIIAGVLGMHLMAGTHGTHAAAPGNHIGQVSIQSSDTPAPPSCTCEGGCTTMSSSGAACTPVLGSASLAAPLPGTRASIAGVDATAMSGPVAAYSYVPAAPSPGELSISRT